jgi:GT2 family glycosyltransferase
MTPLRCSVIVPSYQRRQTLELVLQGLVRQTLAPSEFEVIVVLDGSTDSSAAMLAEWTRNGKLPNLRWEWQPNQGQAAARNAGVRRAQGPILIFLDDDIVPAPDLLAVHLEHHWQDEPLAVLGDCRVVREQADSFYRLYVWAWWEDKFHTRALPNRQVSYRDFCAGNVSLRHADFLRAGGFDSAFRGYGGEDFELGYRLLLAGVRFVADRRAQARHYHGTTVPGALRVARQEGAADVLLGRKHPALRRGLPLIYAPWDLYGLWIRMAVVAPWLGDLLVVALTAGLPFYERLKLRQRWLTTFMSLRAYAYWRGVSDALGTWRAVRSYQAGAEAVPVYTIELGTGLPTPLPPLWVEGPSQVVLTRAGQRLGVVNIPRHIEAPLPQYLANAILEQLGAELVTASPQLRAEGHGLEPGASRPNWRRVLYQRLYRGHEPVYHWYSQRGWSWLAPVREAVKRVLLHQASRADK